MLSFGIGFGSHEDNDARFHNRGVAPNSRLEAAVSERGSAFALTQR